MVSEYVEMLGVKFACIVALPLVSVTVVLAEEEFAIVAAPLVTVQFRN
jgi:hypothetical protein